METPLSVLLGLKEHKLITLTSFATVAEAIEIMVKHKIGSVMVVYAGTLNGIFTERDVLNLVDGSTIDQTTPIKEVMSTDLITVSSHTTVGEAMDIMTNKRCRHLPVVDQGKVVGLISIGDITKWIVESQGAKIHDLENYITGTY